MKILFIGDVFGEIGREMINDYLHRLVKDKEIDFEGRFFIVDFFFCRNIAKMQWKARKNGYFYIKVASRNITTEVQ